ncbi:hypothetical protein V5O48_018098 [Marasmius crinis-equi]|uniref:Uncharacterized protein n=1 Tax=Marasmius crinis-equi TaxID=585013 RepID=A0ABR3EMC5_9AGAR
MVADINGRILPHVLKAPVNVEVLQSYAEYLNTEMNRFATETADQSHIREIITELLTSALKHLDLFRMQAITNPSQNSNPPTTTHKGDPASAMRFITQCLESGNPTIAFAALRQMTDINGQTEDIAQARATTVLLPLLELLEKEPKARLLLSQQRELVTELLTSIADHLDLFQLKRVANPSGPGYSYSQSNSETTVKGDPGPALSLVIRCLEYGSPTLAACALRRMKNVDGKSKEVADAQVITVLLPLLELMGKDVKTKSFLSNNQEIVTELLTAALNGVDLFQIKTATTKAGWPSYRVTPTTKGDPAMAMNFIAQCLESGNMAIASNALRRMAVMYGQPSDMAQVRATTVLLPLLQHLQKDPRTNRFLPDLPLACISEAAVPHALRAFKARAGSLTEDSICLLLDSIVIGKTPQLLTTAILPAIRSFPWNEASWKSWMEQVLSRRRAFAANNLTFSTQISAAVAEMAKTYAQKVTLPTLQPYYGARVPTDQSAKFLTILNTCVRLGGTAALEVALKRLLEHKSTVEYLQNALVPLIPGLCQLAQRQGLSVSAEPFASSIRKIMDNWTKSVLGPKPDEATSAPLLAKLKKYTCSQSDCLKVQRFLLIPNTRNTLRLERIGAPTRKHIEKELQVHAAGAATFEMIRTTPQGLQIKKHDSLYQSARWKTIQQEGMKVLKEIGQLAPLQAIWGSAYPTFMNKMGITPTNTPTVAHASNTNTTRSAAPIAGPSQSLQSRVAVPTAAPHRPRPPHPGRSIPVTPAKRKAAAAAADDDDDDIIDLTITP